MSISVISICNRALDLLGADPITALEDGSKAARLCGRNYAPSRDAVLRSYPWNSAMRRTLLAATTEAPVWGYRHRYHLPVDCLKVWRVEQGEAWSVEGRSLFADYAPPLPIFYVAAIEDPSFFDPLLADAVALRLAWHLALNLTESAARADAIRLQYENTLQEARVADAQEGAGAQFITDDWLNSRY